jgi:hypothetical protein
MLLIVTEDGKLLLSITATTNQISPTRVAGLVSGERLRKGNP